MAFLKPLRVVPALTVSLLGFEHSSCIYVIWISLESSESERSLGATDGRRKLLRGSDISFFTFSVLSSGTGFDTDRIWHSGSCCGLGP